MDPISLKSFVRNQGDIINDESRHIKRFLYVHLRFHLLCAVLRFAAVTFNKYKSFQLAVFILSSSFKETFMVI